MPTISHGKRQSATGRGEGGEANESRPVREKTTAGSDQCRHAAATPDIPRGNDRRSAEQTVVLPEKKAGRTPISAPGRITDGVCLLLWLAGVLVCEERPVALTLLCAAILHECGHIAAFLLLGEPMPALHAGRLGLQLRAARPLSPLRECLAAFAGPAVNLLCAAVLWLLFGAGLPFYMHLMTAAGNLAPVGALDGGRILRTLCETHFSPRTAWQIWRCVSFLVLCAGLCVSLCTLWCRGEGGYLFFLCFSLFLSHIAGKSNG